MVIECKKHTTLNLCMAYLGRHERQLYVGQEFGQVFAAVGQVMSCPLYQCLKDGLLIGDIEVITGH